MSKKEKHAPSVDVPEASVETKPEVATPEPKVAVPKQRGPRGTDEGATITVLAASNPKRKDSKAAKVFDLYQTGMTVKAFCDAADELGKGEGTPNLVYDTKHGFISIDGYDPGAIIAAKPKAEPKVKVPKEPKAKKEKVAKAEPEVESEVSEETMD